MAKTDAIKAKDVQPIKLMLASEKEKLELQKLSTEKLIIWIVGKSNELSIQFSNEEIVLESWLINPQKHSMRKFNQYPDSHVIIKRIGEMKGKKGLLIGSETIGYKLTDISKIIYANLLQQISTESIVLAKGKKIANREITSIDETPYNRLKKTSAYQKYQQNRLNEIVESDFLYFYGITWHSKKSFIQNRYKNIDDVVKRFSQNDKILQGLIQYFSEHFSSIKKQLIEK